MLKARFGRSTKILGGVSALALAALIGVGATVAYFSGTATGQATITTATIGVDSQGFPLTFGDMLPGHVQSHDIWVQNKSSAPGDLFVQMVGTPSPAGEANFCIPDQVLNIGIYDLDANAYWYNGTICNLYPGTPSSTIPKVGDDVPSNQWVHLRIDLTLAATAGNSLQGKTNTDTVNLIAVQYDGPAPNPNKQGFESGAYADPWPVDNFAPDDDTNYS